MAPQIVDILLDAARDSNTTFYDLCCGSGAIAIELVNRGIDPNRIVMLDMSSWGVFWSAIGAGTFNLGVFEKFLAGIPDEKRNVKSFMTELASQPVGEHEAEIYPILQASSFGGKQIWRAGGRWANAFFRDYWEPTQTSIRRSPANPMQPSPEELSNRVSALSIKMLGVKGLSQDITTFDKESIAGDAVVYVDPPYGGTTGYGFGFDVASFAETLREKSSATLFISEGTPLSSNSVKLNFGGAKGGISGKRVLKHEEWVSRF